ncbi:TetR/AcrR family transcriptional regulator [Novosphingobium ginsenosidimutans]|uniref:TetR/AcrR family transcriptional regulator n=1 Tax=Novosphingobium ginsenosidimutans TaxID=1176536 RepID=A0A5B8S782_9SPHN|nr:TetR/AcrR family transcriptional regulator [Novosphingobium ginsenosidimutans]QEA16527.1 TetR/AcrR family transcriptional regulator [Novosphingobium ginsenosidimutans]
MRYTSEHKHETRTKILNAAARVLREQGPDRLAIGEVMASVGLTHGGFYAHFPSKDALVEEALATMFGEARLSGAQLKLALADPQADVRAALRGFLSGYLSPAHRDGKQAGCPLPVMASDSGRSAGPTRDHFSQGLQRITGTLVAALDRIGHSDPQAIARAIVSRMVGAVAIARALGPGAESDAVLRDSLLALKEELGL